MEKPRNPDLFEDNTGEYRKYFKKVEIKQLNPLDSSVISNFYNHPNYKNLPKIKEFPSLSYEDILKNDSNITPKEPEFQTVLQKLIYREKHPSPTFPSSENHFPEYNIPEILETIEPIYEDN